MSNDPIRQLAYNFEAAKLFGEFANLNTAEGSHVFE